MTARILFAGAALVALSSPGMTQTAPSGQSSDAAPQSQDHAAHAQAATGGVALAAKEDVRAGLTVVDQSGGTVGKVESLTATGAVVSTGAARAEIPFASFGKSDKGLVIAMTKAQLEAAARGG